MKTRLLTLAALILGIAACERQPDVPVPAAGSFRASFDEVTSKSSLEGKKAVWEAGDVISVNGYEYRTEAGGENAVFDPVGEGAPEADEYIAVYPATLSVSGKTVTGVVPSAQTARNGDFPEGLNYAAAKSSTRDLTFKNLLSLVKVQLNTEGVNSIELSAGNGEILSGAFTADFSGDTPVVAAEDGAESVVLSNDGGTGERYLVVIPQALQQGFTVTFGLDTPWSKTRSTAVEFGRSELVNLGAFSKDEEGYFITKVPQNFFVKPGATGSGQSWQDAMDIYGALTAAADHDVIHLAAGTYTASETFSITQNITLQGGYNADPVEGDLPDPAAQKAVLDGNDAVQVLKITAAPGAHKKVTVSGLVLQNGNTTSNGGGLFINKSDADIRYVDILDNSANMGAGFLVTGGANADFYSCLIIGNKASGNGANYIYDGAKARFDRCIFRSNETAGAGAAVYAYTNTQDVIVTIADSEISGNKATGRGGAVYARAAAASTTLNIANTTIFNNKAGHMGSAVAFYGTATSPVVAQIISSTITDNTSTNETQNYGGAIGIETAGITVNLYNTIVSGNHWSRTPKPNCADLYSRNTSSTSVLNRCILGASVYGSNAVDSAAPTFDAATMLTQKEETGKTTVYRLTGTDNPALTYGYDAAGLKALGSVFSDDVISSDQWGNARPGSAMGAYVGN